ncbi:MAG: FtsQ-type POTRA domain-containing protein [Candidatus Adiutrix sp.]|jgi:cell division septal protein FtsQ|nr:FtsQ-type POTRA domain-containing protein [Candidatus Adiutrix sp.]
MAKTEHREAPGRAGQVRFARPKPARRRRKVAAAPGPSLAGLLLRFSLKSFGKGLKLVGLALATAAALVAVSGLILGGYLYVSNSDYFTIKKIAISGLNHAGSDEVLAAAGLNRPVNSLIFNSDQAVREITALPWVAEARISRQMPDAVSIEVQEHNPRLLVSLGRLYYLNDQGEPFKELAPGENPQLPIVSGFNEDDLLNPGPRVREAIDEVFWLVDALTARNDEFRLDNVSEINYDMVRGLTLFTKSNGLEVKIGFGSYDEKFRRLGRVMAHLKQRGQYAELAYLNLEASPRVTVRYQSGRSPDLGVGRSDGSGPRG